MSQVVRKVRRLHLMGMKAAAGFVARVDFVRDEKIDGDRISALQTVSPHSH